MRAAGRGGDGTGRDGERSGIAAAGRERAAGRRRPCGISPRRRMRRGAPGCCRSQPLRWASGNPTAKPKPRHPAAAGFRWQRQDKMIIINEFSRSKRRAACAAAPARCAAAGAARARWETILPPTAIQRCRKGRGSYTVFRKYRLGPRRAGMCVCLSVSCVCVCAFARKYIVAEPLGFGAPKARTKRRRFGCLGRHSLTCTCAQLAPLAEGLSRCFAEFVVQPVARMYVLVKEEARTCVNPCFVYVTLGGPK